MSGMQPANRLERRDTKCPRRGDFRQFKGRSMRRLFLLSVFIFCSLTSLQATYLTGSTKNIELIGYDPNFQGVFHDFQVVAFFNEAVITTNFRKTYYRDNSSSIEPNKQTFSCFPINTKFEPSRLYGTTCRDDCIIYMFVYDQPRMKNHTVCAWIKYTPMDDSFEAWYKIEEVHRNWD